MGVTLPPHVLILSEVSTLVMRIEAQDILHYYTRMCMGKVIMFGMAIAIDQRNLDS